MSDTGQGFHLVLLQVAEAPKYNRFFRQGALEHPDTLRISPEDVSRGPFQIGERPGTATFAAVSDQEEWLGVVTIEREGGRDKRSHIAWVLRMYVARAHAGKGIGRALMAQAIARARAMPGVAKVNLTVAEHNERGVRLYESFGFRAFSREEDAFRDPTSRTELTMSLRLE